MKSLTRRRTHVAMSTIETTRENGLAVVFHTATEVATIIKDGVAHGTMTFEMFGHVLV